MADQLSFMNHSDQGSSSERSDDSPSAASEDDSSGHCGHISPPDPDWTEERFRVDRKKLETMLLAASEGRINGGEDFFQKVMDETNTQIAWPSKLKIGAKSKKDPHIKVSGKREDVREAKEKIMSVLDTKSNRVTLKMDVSHTEHSHVIGKGGNNIKRVMDETGCHIHFPDSNRHSQGEKSNQVSIAGQPAGVEAARVKIRELLPLVLMFECSGVVQQVDCSSPVVQHISHTYNVSISFKPPSRLYGNTAIVRGNQNNANGVKRGTALLLEHLAGSLASSVLVSTQLDIAPQHHLFLLGRNGANIRLISQRTGAHIQFPELNTHSHSPTPTSRSAIYIQGSIDAVYAARQQLMGCLPLVLMFDIKEETEVASQVINTLMEQLDVFISIKPKPKQPSKSVIVKSVERNAGNMYEVRRILLSLESSYIASSICNVAVNGHNHTSPPLIGSVGLDTLASAGLRLSTLGSDTFVEVGMPRSPSHSANGNELKQMLASCTTSSGKRQTVELLQRTKNSLLHVECVLADSDCENTMADKRAPGSERAAERRLAPHIQAFDYEKKKLLATKAMLKKPVVTEVRTPTNTWSGLGFSKSMPAEGMKELRRANHVPYKPSMSTTYEDSHLSVSHSGSQESLSNGTESDNWGDRNGNVNINGNGLSGNSEFSPAVSSPKRLKNKSIGEQYLSSSNYMDSISLSGSNGCSLSSSFKGTDLPELFSKLGLGKYTDIFQQQEIDLQTFVTLTDQDLKELGITTFGARRKMLLAISELNKSRRKLFDTPNIRSSFLDGGASGRLSRQFHTDMASVSGRW
ncbi:protein bicaudal C homolog 1-B isoform X4 [Misgurnus anguillicaudatus]|uniref:protein bicaudal C homolog 1-B isoform X4 n=1 Tax=Misgurnus anguillicaudatus TaxID=75329 RepID=UPI0024352220|nr:protein bicaudal C homolog 1-B isoform X4 [Misgurnus anguillicaudatus]